VLFERHDPSSYLLIFAILYPSQEKNTAFIAEARSRYDSAKICDLPECRVKAADTVTQTLQICPRCRVATYCCQEHFDEHWPQHIPLCDELLRRICDYPECRLSVEDLKCSRCLQARYCCHEHGALDWRRHRAHCEKKSDA
jgi:hypothetical protein